MCFAQEPVSPLKPPDTIRTTYLFKPFRDLFSSSFSCIVSEYCSHATPELLRFVQGNEVKLKATKVAAAHVWKACKMSELLLGKRLFVASFSLFQVRTMSGICSLSSSFDLRPTPCVEKFPWVLLLPLCCV